MKKKTVANPTKPVPSVVTAARAAKASPAASPPPSPESPEEAVVVVKAKAMAAPQTVQTAFVHFDPHATQVSLCGEFNAWSPAAAPMKRQADGHWQTTLALRPGRYQYKFVVDGQWLPDPNARAFVPNDFGSLNSLIDVRG
jgi:1,4-alpha-glucan branching enzyme